MTQENFTVHKGSLNHLDLLYAS